MPDELVLKCSARDVNLIMTALSRLPFGDVAPTHERLRAQIMAQSVSAEDKKPSTPVRMKPSGKKHD